ncbi:hypothetical protein DM02DRAFT_678066 [Periconia macrospinosa]|uniref:BTB domain-containing protein n=1 Tax=Periconia macrospinosa TaxID=97972 RepID=A0A2V1D1I8_9PLEO|nr:hypothetical protein DM02DRAFT_678066 [Periconia macrospinosa]
MENHEDNQLNIADHIAVDGDVVLVIGPEMVKLRVHSLFLKVTSKPFAAMFRPDWKEGKSLPNRTEPAELSLPEDDPAAMRLICAVIHHKNDEVPHTLPARKVLAIAITADKYDCLDVLRFASEMWLIPDKHETGNLMLLAAAAYVFRAESAFKEITKALLLTYCGPYLTLSCEEIESAMTWRVFCQLEEARSFARLALADILLKGVNDPTGICVHKCGWSSKYAYAYIKLLERHDLWPKNLFLLSISEAIELAEKIPDPIPEEPSGHCTFAYKHSAPEYRKYRRWSIEELIKSMSLCLYCVRAGSSHPYQCRTTH